MSCRPAGVDADTIGADDIGAIAGPMAQWL
jgi:hypothetical protein